VHECLDLPETEMPGEHQDAAALGLGLAHTLLTVELDVRQHLFAREGAELEQDHQQTAKVLEHLPGDHPALGVRPQRKCNLQILYRKPPVAAVDGVERAAEQGSSTEHR